MDIDYTGVPSHQMEAAKILFETVASVLNRAARAAITVDANFYSLGGNSLNSIYTITKLNEKGLRIGMFSSRVFTIFSCCFGRNSAI